MAAPADKRTFRSGELAKLVGVSRDTLRHYERKRVLPRPMRLPNGYREYPEDAVERIHVIRRALAVGFTLDELARIFQRRSEGGIPCKSVRHLAATKLAQLRERISEMRVLESQLEALVKEWDSKLRSLPLGTEAHLLDSFAKAPASSTKTRRVPPAKRAFASRFRK
ncbi:MAG TPA: heavy metal-responsive transcriptional regulator [Thermoanaerobaculia bacterium]|nr:heavy metal-responsive transcriptional regulator [Thermoanaerobaculia bacterium]